MKIFVIVLALVAVESTVDAQHAMPSHPAGAPARPASHEIARVNGTALMSDRLDAAVNRLIPLESFHRAVNPEKIAEIRTKALNGLVEEELEYQDGVRLGIRVTAAQVDTAVTRGKKSFKSAAAFEERLRTAGVSMVDVRREIRRSLIIEKAEQRVVTSKCQVDANEAGRFFAANPERFVVPEQLHVHAITIGVEPSASSDDWAKARTRAEDVLRQIHDGASFEEMARKFSTDKKSKTAGGDMGLVHRGSLNDEFEQALRNLSAGGVSDIVKTLFGYHIVRLTEIRPPQKKTFAQVGADIRKDLTSRRCAEMKDAWIARLRAAASITP